MSEISKGELLREELLMNPKNLTETMSEEELKAAYEAKKSASGVTYDETWQAAVDAAKAAQA